MAKKKRIEAGKEIGPCHNHQACQKDGTHWEKRGKVTPIPSCDGSRCVNKAKKKLRLAANLLPRKGKIEKEKQELQQIAA